MRAYIHKQNQPQQQASFNIIRSGTAAPPTSQQARLIPHAQPAIANQDFSRISVHSKSPTVVQTKLTVGSPTDIYEQEADRVAEQVLHASEPQLQRACTAGGCLKQLDQEDESLQTKGVDASDSGQTQVPPIVHEVLASPGQPLDPAARGFMEPRFGHDFSRVRVHTDSQAARSATALHAQAYTVGRDVVFAEGQFASATSAGRRLLAHELAHVVQQQSLSGFPPTRVNGLAAAPAPAGMLQRQQQPAPAPAPAPPKPKSLNAMGIGAQDKLSVKTMLPLIDEVFKRNPTIAPYIKNRLTQGREIAEQGKVIVHKTPELFKDAYKKNYGEEPDKSTRGFYWEVEVSGKTQNYRDEIHLRPDATFGDAFHEAVHKMSAGIAGYLSGDADLAFDVNEGLTSLFSIIILKDEGVTDYRDGYGPRRAKVQKIIDEVTMDTVAKWYWMNDRVDLLSKIGVQQNSKDEAKQVIQKLKKIMR